MRGVQFIVFITARRQLLTAVRLIYRLEQRASGHARWRSGGQGRFVCAAADRAKDSFQLPARFSWLTAQRSADGTVLRGRSQRE